jgi:hypothetical protein
VAGINESNQKSLSKLGTLCVSLILSLKLILAGYFLEFEEK